MSDPRDVPLTPDERAALDRLPRERDPGARLRERTLAEMRRRGAFATAGGPDGARPADSGAGTGRRVRWLIGTVAAAAVFAAGIAVGAAIAGGGDAAGTRAEAPVPDERPGGDAADPAATARLEPGWTPLRVQRSGTAYVEAIARLAQEGDAADPQGRDAALGAFRGAAEHLARLGGHDPATRQVLLAARALDPAGPLDFPARASGTDPGVVERWF